VEEILKLTSKEEWRFCPGKLNPTYIPSRGLKGKELVESKVWWKCPEFLYNPETEWPTSPEGVTMPDKDACTEMAKEPLNISHSLVNATVDCATADLNQIIDCCRYNSFGKLVRITAYVLRFVRNLRCSVEKKNEKKANDLTSSELDEAENCLVKNIQAKSFSKEIQFLKENMKTTNQCSLFMTVRHIFEISEDDHPRTVTHARPRYLMNFRLP
jgi:hypothetical protein